MDRLSIYIKIILVKNVIGRALEVKERENIENGWSLGILVLKNREMKDCNTCTVSKKLNDVKNPRAFNVRDWVENLCACMWCATYGNISCKWHMVWNLGHGWLCGMNYGNFVQLFWSYCCSVWIVKNND